MIGVQKILAIWKKFCQIFSVIPSFLIRKWSIWRCLHRNAVAIFMIH